MSYRFIASGDLHVDDKEILQRPRLPVCMQMMEDLVTLAERHDVRDIFSAGDLYTQKKPSYEVLEALRKHFKKAFLTKGIRYHLLEGNHEALLKSQPQKTFLSMFSEISHVVTKPQRLCIQKVHFWLVPWCSGAKHIRLLESCASEAVKVKGRKILITHCGLREGWVGSPGNKINQRMSIKHLFPNIFDLVLIGDYHAHQMMADNAFYMGAPIPHSFGDTHIMGPWLVTVEGKDINCEPLLLPHRAPEFHEYVLEDKTNLQIRNFRDGDYNRIYCHASVIERVRVMYPGADVEKIKRSDTPDFSGTRFSKDELRDPSSMMKKYLKLRGIPKDEVEDILKLGNEIVQEAKKS